MGVNKPADVSYPSRTYDGQRCAEEKYQCKLTESPKVHSISDQKHTIQVLLKEFIYEYYMYMMPKGIS